MLTSQNERRAVLSIGPICCAPPVPDGTIDAADRRHVIGLPVIVDYTSRRPGRATLARVGAAYTNLSR